MARGITVALLTLRRASRFSLAFSLCWGVIRSNFSCGIRTKPVDTSTGTSGKAITLTFLTSIIECFSKLLSTRISQAALHNLQSVCTLSTHRNSVSRKLTDLGVEAERTVSQRHAVGKRESAELDTIRRLQRLQLALDCKREIVLWNRRRQGCQAYRSLARDGTPDLRNLSCVSKLPHGQKALCWASSTAMPHLHVCRPHVFVDLT